MLGMPARPTDTTVELSPRRRQFHMAFSYLSDDPSELAEVLQRDIPWETYMTARLITDKDLQLIRRYDKRAEDLQASLIDESGPAFIEAFLSVLRGVTKEETVQYVLATLLELLAAQPSRCKLFHAQSELHLASQPDPYTVFLRLLQRQDWFTQEKACKLLAIVIDSRPRKSSAFANGILSSDVGSSSSHSGTEPAEGAISSFMDWLCAQLRRPSNPSKSIPTAISALAALLREKGCRTMFQRAGGVPLVAPLLRSCNSPSNSQILYEICMCLWQMSFNRNAAEVMASAGVVKGLVEVCKTAQKEKVFRVALSTLKNLIQYEGLGVASDMAEAGLTKAIATKQLQSWGDEDIPDMLAFMEERLKVGIQELSSYDKYKKEVLSGCLDWTPMHTSELFWRQNVQQFEDKDFQILRVLLKLIESSREVRTLAVACHDLGQFIMHHPQGRYIITDLRGKELVMRHLAHPDPQVQKQALLCIQKIMLTKDKLDFLQGS